MKYLQGIRQKYSYELGNEKDLQHYVLSERMLDILMLERKFMDFLADGNIIVKINEAKKEMGLGVKNYTSLNDFLCDYSNIFDVNIFESYTLYMADETGIMDVMKQNCKNVRGEIPTHYENLTGEDKDIIIWNDKVSKLKDVATILEEVYSEDVLVDSGYLFKEELGLTQYQFSIVTIFPKEEYASMIKPEILSVMILNNDTGEDYALFPVYVEETKDEHNNETKEK